MWANFLKTRKKFPKCYQWLLLDLGLRDDFFLFLFYICLYFQLFCSKSVLLSSSEIKAMANIQVLCLSIFLYIRCS